MEDREDKDGGYRRQRWRIEKKKMEDREDKDDGKRKQRWRKMKNTTIEPWGI